MKFCIKNIKQGSNKRNQIVTTKRKEEQKGQTSCWFPYYGWKSNSKVNELKWYRAYFTIIWFTIEIRIIRGQQISQ